MSIGAQSLLSGCPEEISSKLRRSDIGSHFLVEYPDLVTLRELYSYYIKSALNDGEEIVVVLPFYETVDTVRRVLSEDPASIDVRKYEKEQRLLIMDSLKGYFGSVDGLMPFVKQTVDHAKSSGRRGVTVLGDMGSFFYYDKEDDLVGWEMNLPRKFDIDLKGFCLYHAHDVKRFSAEDKQKLFQHHSKVVHLIPSPLAS
jgi:MEDS: MEthanogen/methylotroph, DcmR Sensory domain